MSSGNKPSEGVNCVTATGSLEPLEPVITETIPSIPWDQASADFSSMLVMIDNHSKYPKMEIVPITAAGEVMPKIEKIMVSQGFIKNSGQIMAPYSMGKNLQTILSHMAHDTGKLHHGGLKPTEKPNAS